MHLVGFIINKFVTMQRGHMSVKISSNCWSVISFNPMLLYYRIKSPSQEPNMSLNKPPPHPKKSYGSFGEEKISFLPGNETRFHSRLACSQSLYRVSYPGSLFIIHIVSNSRTIP
jgi:hypothetical protein